MLTAGVYHKWLYHQQEYVSTPFEVIFNPSDNLSKQLIEGQGRNYGAHVMLEKRSGRLTGWVSYAWGRAQRHYPGTALLGEYPASHERVHELNALATYQLNLVGALLQHWCGPVVRHSLHQRISTCSMVTLFRSSVRTMGPDLAPMFGSTSRPTTCYIVEMAANMALTSRYITPTCGATTCSGVYV